MDFRDNCDWMWSHVPPSFEIQIPRQKEEQLPSARGCACIHRWEVTSYPHWGGPERERLGQHGNARTRRVLGQKLSTGGAQDRSRQRHVVCLNMFDFKKSKNFRFEGSLEKSSGLATQLNSLLQGTISRISMVVQGLRVRLAMQGTQVRFLVQEPRSHLPRDN